VHARPVLYLLDTCFLSDLAKPVVPGGVAAWSHTHDANDCGISVLTIGELRNGIELLPEGRRKSAMQEWLARDVIQRFDGRTFDVTADIAQAWGILAARSRQSNHRVSAADGLIIGTAIMHHMTVVTRNMRDFAGYDVPVVNPWDTTEE
jgi:toxin FitB